MERGRVSPWAASSNGVPCRRLTRRRTLPGHAAWHAATLEKSSNRTYRAALWRTSRTTLLPLAPRPVLPFLLLLAFVVLALVVVRHGLLFDVSLAHRHVHERSRHIIGRRPQ